MSDLSLANRMVTGKYKKNADFLATAFKKFGSISIFAFALTPLPDDLMFVPLGMARYNPSKAFVPSLAGKSLLSLLIVFGSRFSVSIIANAFGAGGSLLSFLISAALGIALTVTMFKVDWTKHFGKYIK
jgi:membrane protein DedA with SNARE-associated domain